jgi:putative glutamine amidotransferase
MAPNDRGRDSFGAALIHAAITAGKPVFGICRGLQEINVALGGTLRDMREGSGAELHHASQDASLAETFGHTHEVSVATGTVLQRYATATALTVNSVHFQAIDRLADGLVANATSLEGVIEAISALKTPAPVFAVQWHPEWQPQDRPHDLAFWKYLGEVARANYLPAPGSEISA